MSQLLKAQLLGITLVLTTLLKLSVKLSPGVTFNVFHLCIYWPK